MDDPIPRPRFSREQSAERQQARQEELEAWLGRAVTQLVEGEDWRRAVQFASRFRSRSFLNTLLIHAQHSAAHAAGRVPEPWPSYVAGFADWRKLGREPIKGQQGYIVRAPVHQRLASSTPSDPASWRRLGKREEPRAGEAVQRRMVGVTAGYVWDLSQTTGDPVPEQPRPHLLAGEAPTGLLGELTTRVVAEGYGYMVALNPDGLGGALGLTDFSTRLVYIRDDLDPAQRAKTLAHELGHVLLHAPSEVPGNGRPSRELAEVEAEWVALMVGDAVGLDTSDYSIPYIAGWADAARDQTVVQAIASAGENARRAATSIIDGLHGVATVGDGLPRALAPTSMPVGSDPLSPPAPSAPEAELAVGL